MELWNKMIKVKPKASDYYISFSAQQLGSSERMWEENQQKKIYKTFCVLSTEFKKMREMITKEAEVEFRGREYKIH